MGNSSDDSSFIFLTEEEVLFTGYGKGVPVTFPPVKLTMVNMIKAEFIYFMTTLSSTPRARTCHIGSQVIQVINVCPWSTSGEIFVIGTAACSLSHFCWLPHMQGIVGAMIMVPDTLEKWVLFRLVLNVGPGLGVLQIITPQVDMGSSHEHWRENGLGIKHLNSKVLPPVTTISPDSCIIGGGIMNCNVGESKGLTTGCQSITIVRSQSTVS